jgi:ketosteroid isomerase-like protein
MVPDGGETSRRLASAAIVAELFSRIDAGDVSAALELYCDDATFLHARGKDQIRAAMQQGISSRPSRHLITNVRARSEDDAGTMVIEYTAAAFTLEGGGPFAARAVLDQRQRHRRDPDGVLRIMEHQILGY